MVRRPRVLVVLAAAAIAIAALTAAPATAAVHPLVSTVPTSISSLSLTSGTTSLAGAQLTTLTVRLHLVDPDGVVPRSGVSMDRGWNCPCVVLESQTSAGAPFRASPQAVGMRLMSLTLESGTSTDGVWTGRTFLGAGDAGFWRATGLDAGDFQDTTDQPYPVSFVAMPADVEASAVVNLRGYDWPLMRVTVPSAITVVGQRFVVTGSIATSRTRRPVAGLRIVLGTGAMCTPLDACAGTAVRSTSTGGFALSSTDFHSTWAALWAQDANGFSVGYASAQRRHVRSTVTVGSHLTSVRAGTALKINGHVTPWADDLGAAHLVLQRYYSGTWHNVGTTSAYLGGYALKAFPPRGSWMYRVRVLTGYDCFGTSSPTFTLRGV
ncbi:MAG TPA: hypothetical protein VFL59_11720 [Candidatus Nanopelagicales bacterium]|nr:hypothetical protein [Candidatus Nanopelagicales bacterium]